MPSSIKTRKKMAKGDFIFEVSEADYARITTNLDKLSDIEKSTVLKQGFKQGSTMLLTAGKASFLAKNKKHKGNLYRSFTDKLNKKKKGITGIFTGFRRGKGKGNHSHLIDKGTTHRFTKKGDYRGKIDQAGVGKNGYKKTGATYFWSNTVDTRGDTAMQRVVDAIYRYLNAIK